MKQLRIQTKIIKKEPKKSYKLNSLHPMQLLFQKNKQKKHVIMRNKIIQYLMNLTLT